MFRSSKWLIAAVLALSLGACAVVPAPYPAYGYGHAPRVDVITVRSAPVYRVEGGYRERGWHHHHGHDGRRRW